MAETIIETVIPSGRSVLNIPEALSQLNRKMYRSGMDYAIQNIEIYGDASGASSATVYVQRLNRNWVTANSWVKAFHHWKDQQREALEDAGGFSTLGRYNDFKIYMDDEHASLPQLQPLNVVGIIQAQVTSPNAVKDWFYSQIVTPNTGVVGNTDEFFVHMNGPDTGSSKGLIHAYAESRSRPFISDPNVVTQIAPDVEGGLYAEMQDVGDDIDDVITNARFRNNSPPYIITDDEHEFYPGGAEFPPTVGGLYYAGLTTQDHLIIRAGSTISTDSTGPFAAYCGLIKFVNTGDSVLGCRVKVMEGNYSGVMARPMQEVN